MNSIRAEKNTIETELLAPAGSVEALRAAFQAGADAVYIGGDRFGARAYADNPGEEELLASIDLAHRLGKRLYMTVNTLLKDQELETELYRWMRPYVEEGLDGVIIQDFGAVRLFQHMFPELPLHASTQMTVTGLHGAEFLKQQGFVRVVPARELSLKEIRQIREKTGLEVETFIHGAMCYAYSGQCLFSSMLGGRSGNRGRCAGICRLPFEVYRADSRFRQGEKLENPLLPGAGKRRDGRRRENYHREYYPLNMKDMCTLEILSDLVQAGISSLKIEGRMKKPEYTAGVVSVYRKYLDLWRENPDTAVWHVEEADKKFLWDLFNRDGFNKSYYYEKNGRDMIALNNEKLDHVRQQAAQQLTDQIRKKLAEPEMQLRLQAPVSGVLVIQEGSARLELTLLLSGDPEAASPIQVSLEREGVQRAQKQPVTRERVQKQMEKTGNSLFRFASLEIQMGENLFLPMQLLNELRREGFALLEQSCRDRFRRNTAAMPLSRDEEKTEKSAPEEKRPECREALPVWASVEQEEQLAVLSEMNGLTGVYLPAWLYSSSGRVTEYLSRMKAHGIRAGLALPPVLRERNEEFCRKAVRCYLDLLDEQTPRILIRNLEEAGLVELLFREAGRDLPSGTILDSGVWTMNTEAEQWFADRGFQNNTVSPELNRKELLFRDNTQSELIVYGRTPLMLAQQCLQKTMDHCDRGFHKFLLKDRKKVLFPVQCDCSSCTNIIYNSLPTSLLGLRGEVAPLACASLRLCFTTEDSGETGQMTDAFLKEYRAGETENGKLLEQGQFTRGHFHRGVL